MVAVSGQGACGYRLEGVMTGDVADANAALAEVPPYSRAAYIRARRYISSIHVSVTSGRGYRRG